MGCESRLYNICSNHYRYYEVYFIREKPRSIMKSDKQLIRELYGNNYFITKLIDIKDPNIQILDIINKDTQGTIKLDYDAPSCPEENQLKKYDFQTV